MIFKSISVSDYEILKPFFSGHPYHLSIYSLASIISWSYLTFKAYYAIDEGMLYIAGQSEEKPENRHLILPISGERTFTPLELKNIAVKLGFDRYWYAPGDYLEGLNHSELESLFVIEEQKEFEDYVYLADDLIRLRGNKFSKKRNLIHQFSREYLMKDRATVEGILPEHVEECLQFLETWCEQYECTEDQKNNLVCEKNAVTITLKNMARLESRGILVRVDGKISAFGIGSRLNDTTAVLNFEKADSTIKGLYQFLDNECAKRLFNGFRYINKESDMNMPNLAESKQSYHPVLRIKSYSLGLR
ncbi:MAG: phosphatidylglycerol lysyltransferase domain-containing protein [Deltaproteobacteria bacterium]|nr:phosphatidylglycerol lysyltransferase domain-containing protein [Deltaproteobacteria bacterium]